MGWIGAFKIQIWVNSFDPRLLGPLLGGGIMYTAGVPFFVVGACVQASE
jgi:hypothetical protein